MQKSLVVVSKMFPIAANLQENRFRSKPGLKGRGEQMEEKEGQKLSSPSVVHPF
jgi:hypothetical protein